MTQRREPPRRFGSSWLIGMKNLVARNTSSRRPSRASPTISSEMPAEYTSAVSTKLTPASSARWMMRVESSRSSLPQGPNIIVPRHSGLTRTPVRPSGRYSMRSGLRDGTTEGFHRDLLGLGAAAKVGVEGIDARELVAAQLEVEHVEVLGDTCGLHR